MKRLKCDEDERGAHSEKSARYGNTRNEKRGRVNLRWKDACRRDMTIDRLREDDITIREEWRK